MADFAKFDANGFPIAFYSEDLFGFRMINSEIPIYGEKPEPTEENPAPEAPIIGFDSVSIENADCKIPTDAVELTPEQYMELINNSGLRKWENGEVVPYDPPTVEQVIIIPAVTLWERMTEAEAEQVAEVMATQPFRTRKIFETAATFRSDHELWPLLEQIANQLFGEARATELLAL